MKILETYVTITENGVTRRLGGTTCEFYSPSLMPDKAAVFVTWGLLEDGSAVELSTMIVKH